MFKNYIADIFRGDKYNKAITVVYSPKSFQKEFKKNAVLGSFTFKTSVLDKKHTETGVKDFFPEYDIKIEAIPKNKDVSIEHGENIWKVLSKNIFGNKKNTEELNEFDESSISVRNIINNSTRTFEWSNKDSEFVPVVYLDDRIRSKNEDGTLAFDELEKFCSTIFKDEILPEIRPDLYAKKVK
jgi:hypothetical protein